MDPISIVISAVCAGATAGMKDTAVQAVKDAYASVKELISNRYGRTSLQSLEENPASPNRRKALEEDLAGGNADQDKDLLVLTRSLLTTLAAHDPASGEIVGVNLKDITAAALTLDDIISAGSGVVIERAETSGNISISGVRAGVVRGENGPKDR